MDILPSISTLALPASLLLLLTLVAVRLRQRQGQRRTAARDALDTVAAWPPVAARVLTVHERRAYDLLRRAMPGFLVLAQVPLARFIRVPMRHSYADWLQRAGSISADLLLCDAGSRVLAVIDVRAAHESERSRRRHERMARVLRAAGVHVYTWNEAALPTLAEVRAALTALINASLPAAARPTASRPMPLIPVADTAEMHDMSALLAAGDRAALDPGLDTGFDARLEPVPSGFYDEMGHAAAQR